MNRMICLCLSMVTLVPLFLPTVSFGQTLDARQIIQKNDQQQKASDEYSEMTMKLINKKGKERTRKVVQYRKLDQGANQKLLIRFLFPPDIKGTGLLIHEHSDRDDEQWLYMPAMDKVRRISSSEKGDNFVGSDFTYQDLKNEAMEQYDYRLTAEENIYGVNCYVIEAIPNNSKEKKESPYSKRLLWISEDHYLTVQVHFYNKKNEQYKIFKAANIQQIEQTDKWRAFQMEMINLKTGHSTVLSFGKIQINQRLSDKIFTQRYLKRGK